MATTSERLKAIMEIRNMKQVDIIERTGINKGALSSYLSGRYIPKQDNIYKLSKALNVNPAWLMGLDVPMEISAEYIENWKEELERVQNQLEPYTKQLAEMGKQVSDKLSYDLDLQNGLRIEIERIAQDYEPEQFMRAVRFMDAFLKANPERQKIALEILQQPHQDDV